MKIGIPVEIFQDEKRVAATPKTVERLIKQGFEVFAEHNAGNKSGFTNEEYITAGAHIVDTPNEILQHSAIILKVKEPTLDEVAQIQPGTVLICYLRPAHNTELLESLKNQGISSFAVDIIPRITRAQKMDVLSSMANISGYRAVIESAFHFGRFLNGQITAAGKVDPAKVLVIGAGVAGLAAIGAANSLGAIVRAFDTRKEVGEQINSMGAQFLTIDINEDGATATGYSKEMSEEFIKAEMQLFLEQAKEVDIVITTAQIPGKKAPLLWLDYHVAAMKPGSIIVDLAAESGGLIAAPTDQFGAWGCNGTPIPGADGTFLGDGAQNTIDIEAGCATAGTAADVYANLVLSGYIDWFLPSKDELNLMYQNIGQGNALGLGNVGGFAFGVYWSSTEADNNVAWAQYFSSATGVQVSEGKNFGYYVRAVRAF